MKNKILTVLLSAALALGLWVYVITVERPESENTFYNVPVVLEGADVLRERGMMITDQTQQTVTLKLSGNRKALNQLKSSDIAAVIDLSRVTEAGEKHATYAVEIPGDADLAVVARQPEAISLIITEWATKEIPVTLNYVGRVPEGYYVDKQSATLDRTSVHVTGPKQIITQIEKAVITLDLEGRSEIIVEDLRYTLCDKDETPIEDVSSVTTDTGEIRTTVSVQKLKELKLTYQVVDGGGLKAADVDITMDYTTLTAAGNAAVIENLEEILLGTVELGTLTESTKLVFPVKLPDGVSNQSGITEVKLDVQIPEMEIREYTITDIQLSGLSDGWKAESLARALTVKIRGRGPVLDRLAADQISVHVDLSHAQLGNATYEATVEIEGFGEADNVGAVEKYTVPVRVDELSSQSQPEA
jgi:YbbR domain-containing protein